MEIELLFDGNFWNAFHRAGLLGSCSDEESIKQIMQCYIVEQLDFMPGGTPKFDRHLLNAYGTLRRGILGESMTEIDSLPPALYMQLQHETSEKVKKHMEDTHQMIAETMLGDLKGKECHLCLA